MKKIILSMAVIGVMTIAALNIDFNSTEKNSLSALSLANVEALAGESNNTCPDAYDVPDHFITVASETVSVTSNSKGEISIGGAVKGGYEKNESISVVISTYNCDGEQEGSCCRQSDVRTEVR